ncbi:MAG: hypothetical protein HYW50_00805 [Candidatus Diapherotrites archaeon]|nr:hypothetical protein [Candidatus Diapherotrites archaeon]
MKHFLVFLIFFVLIASFAGAATVLETKLSDLGYSDFSVEKQGETNCLNVQFNPPSDLNHEVYGIVSVHAEFLPTTSKKSLIAVFLNGKKVGSVTSVDFADSLARFNVRQGEIVEENLLKICGTTSFETQRIKIFSDSTIGYYFKPDFEKEGAFELLVFPQEPNVLEEFKVTAILKNFGSESTDVILNYRKDELEKETPETELVKGETTTTRTISACAKRAPDSSCIEPSEVRFEYLLRPKIVGPISLLPAIAEFQNPFGETVFLESDRPIVKIVEPEVKIKPFVSVQKEQFLPGEKTAAKLIITNEGKDPLFNLFLKIEIDGLTLLRGAESETIEVIKAGESIEREYTLSAIEPGEFSIGCSIDHLDYSVVESNCNHRVQKTRN